MHCYLRLSILAGVMKGQNESVMSLWNEKNVRAILSRSLARNRFTAISKCIRFDDAAVCRRIRSTDKLAPIRNVFELCVKSFQNCYILNKNVTINEQLVIFRDDARFVSLFLQNLASMESKSGLCVIAWQVTCTTWKSIPDEKKDKIEPWAANSVALNKWTEKIRKNVTCDIFYEHQFGSKTC